MTVVLAVIFLLALYCMIIVLKKSSALRYKLIFFIPPFNALIDVLIGPYLLNLEVIGEIRGAIILLYIIAMIPYLSMKGPNKPVYWWLLYLIPLLFFSSNFTLSLSVYLKMTIGYMMLPIGYTLIRNKRGFDKMCLSIASAAYIYIIAFVIFQLFGLGEVVYIEQGFTSFGGGQVQFTQILAYAVIAFPLTYQVNQRLRWKALHVLGHIVGAVVVVLVYHRSSIYAMVFGAFVLGIVGYKRTKLFKYLAIAAVLTFISFQFVLPGVYEDLIEIVQTRSITLQDILESQGGRMAEIRFFTYTYPRSSIIEIFFGQELFNGGSVMGWIKQRGNIRPLHIDYIIVLFGAGIIGFILYLYVYFRTTVLVFRLKEFLPTENRKGFFATYLGLLVACLIMSLANQIWVISSLTVIFFYIGGLIGYSTGEKQRQLE